MHLGEHQLQDPIALIFGARLVVLAALGRRPNWRATTDDDEHYVYAIALP